MQNRLLYSNKVIMPYVWIIMLRASIDKELEKKFRELAMKRFGYSKVSLSKAMEEAILLWISAISNDNLPEFDGDPIEAIEGILPLDINSVELQHKIKDLWISKVLKDVPNRH